MKTLSPLTILYEEQGVGPVSALAFSQQGLLAIGARGVEIWDCSSGSPPEDSLVAFGGADQPALAFSPNGCHIALGQKNGVAIFDLAAATKIHDHRQNGEARAIAWSPSGQLVAACSEYGQYQVWEPATGNVLQEYQFDLPPMFLLWLPDGRLATNPFSPSLASSHWKVQLWNTSQMEVEQSIDDGACLCDDYCCAALSPDARQLALGTFDGFIQLWYTVSGTEPRQDIVISFHMNTVSGVAWSPDGTYLASGSADGHVAVWNARGELLFHTGSRRSGGVGVRDVAWWRDLLAVADDVGRVTLYRIPA